MITRNSRYGDAEKFVQWLRECVLSDGRGDALDKLGVKPADRIWLGRLAPETTAWKALAGERGQRIDPCSVGLRVAPQSRDIVELRTRADFVIWAPVGKGNDRHWAKSERFTVEAETAVDMRAASVIAFGVDKFAAAFAGAGATDRSARFEAEVDRRGEIPALTVTVVNDGPDDAHGDPNLYEVVLEAEVGPTIPFLLDSLPDSFRYDRRVAAYGVNGGVEDLGSGTFRTTDDVWHTRMRPEYWDIGLGTEPDLSFATLSSDPTPSLASLERSMREWGRRHWDSERLDERQAALGWTGEMRAQADREALAWQAEVESVAEGVALIAGNEMARRAFRYMNEAIAHAGRGKYSEWRPFQIGFVLSALPSIIDARHDDREVVETLWFATGGGKTETYLGLCAFTVLYDRVRGKQSGVTAWCRFPLRMLSLQQTQRFADALAGAELARRRHELGGDEISLGFLVGGTPNRIRDEPQEWDVNANDPTMPAKYRVLLRCPYCAGSEISMRFIRSHWTLAHICANPSCSWGGGPLPFHVVDEEIYRLLPSVVVGTLDKAASISLQAAMRGLYASPLGVCTGPEHGYTYAPRSKTPKGCLVPECAYAVTPVGDTDFAPTLLIQDELHLLRDSLGAVDSHYETLLAHLRRATGGHPAKIVASSATLSGFDDQVAELYGRRARAFPIQGPEEGVAFWTRFGTLPARTYVGLAPRGITLELANDLINASLQRAIRQFVSDPGGVAARATIDPANADFLISYYGTQVIYGTRLRDVEAAARSLETQPPVDPLNVAVLTGGSFLDEVQDTLRRLSEPEPDYEDRIHVVCASSMMSHGVDIERLNIISMLGLPLTTAEFIQTTARIGRTWPGLAFVIHRVGGERDAGVYRAFPKYISHGDRFVEAVAITRKSRRVLENTYPGIFGARVCGIHEPNALKGGGRPLSTAAAVRRYFAEQPITENDEFQAACDALGLSPSSDEPLVEALREQVRATFREVLDYASDARFVGELTPRPPMRSLREVEMQVPVRGELP